MLRDDDRYHGILRSSSGLIVYIESEKSGIYIQSIVTSNTHLPAPG